MYRSVARVQWGGLLIWNWREREKGDWELSENRVEKRRTLNKWKRQKTSRHEFCTFFGQLDFRVTRIMILIAAARSRIANIELRYSDVLTEKEHRLLDRIDLKIKTKERERGGGEREREILVYFRPREGQASRRGAARRYERSISLSRQRTMHSGETCGRHSPKVRSPTLKPGCRRVVPFVVVIVNIRVLPSGKKAASERS